MRSGKKKREKIRGCPSLYILIENLIAVLFHWLVVFSYFFWIERFVPINLLCHIWIWSVLSWSKVLGAND